MTKLREDYLDEIKATIWWAQLRATTRENDFGNFFIDADEICNDEERSILQKGLETISELYEQIESQLNKMQNSCPVLAKDRHFVIDFFLPVLHTDEEISWEATKELFTLRSKGNSVVNQMQKLNLDEEQGILRVEDSLPSSLLSDLIEQIVDFDCNSYRNKEEADCLKFYEYVFKNLGFQLAAQISEEAIRTYLFHLAKKLFDRCNTDKFIEVLFALYKRRREHSKIDGKLPS